MYHPWGEAGSASKLWLRSTQVIRVRPQNCGRTLDVLLQLLVNCKYWHRVKEGQAIELGSSPKNNFCLQKHMHWTWCYLELVVLIIGNHWYEAGGVGGVLPRGDGIAQLPPLWWPLIVYNSSSRDGQIWSPPSWSYWSWSSWSQRSSPCLQGCWIITHHFVCNFDVHLFSLCLDTMSPEASSVAKILLNKSTEHHHWYTPPWYLVLVSQSIPFQLPRVIV